MLNIRNFLAALVIGLVSLASASAHEYKAGDLMIDHPWAKPSLKGVSNGAAFLTIKNNGSMDDILVAAKSDVSNVVELHTHIMDDGVMRMRRVEGGIKLPAGKTTKLAPGGYHVMLIGLKKPLNLGDRFPLRLVFQKSGEVQVEVYVEKPKHEGSMKMDHSKMKH